LRGKSDEAPYWVAILLIAKQYQIPPWQVEAECSQEWWDRMNCLSEEMDNMPKPKTGGE